MIEEIPLKHYGRDKCSPGKERARLIPHSVLIHFADVIGKIIKSKTPDTDRMHYIGILLKIFKEPNDYVTRAKDFFKNLKKWGQLCREII